MSVWLTVTFPVILGTFSIAIIFVLKRYMMKDKYLSSLQFLIHWYVLAAFAFGVVYLIFWGFNWLQLLPGFWRAVILGTLVNFFIQYFNVKAASIDKGEVSFTAPLQAMTPGLITILAITLGEFPSRVGIAGICLMALGSYVLLWEKSPQYWYEYFGPLKRILLLLKIGQLSPDERNKTIVVSLALGSACLGTFGLLFDGLYVRRGVNLQGLTIAAMTMVGILAVGYALWYLIRPDTSPEQREAFGIKIYLENKKYLLCLIGITFCWLIMIYTVQPTYSHTFVAYTGTLKRFQILISVVLGYIFFHEKEFKKRIWAAVLIVLGVVLISMDDLPARISTQMQIWGL